MQSARLLEQPVGETECVDVPRSAADDERQQFVVAKRGDAESFELLAWSIVWGNGFHVDSVFYASSVGVASSCHASRPSRLCRAAEQGVGPGAGRARRR